MAFTAARLGLAACFVTLTLPLVADDAKPDASDARELLGRISKVYAVCKSYRDSGTVKVVYLVDGNTETKSFTTAFVRPNRFRFEYREEGGNSKGDRYIVWRNAKDLKTWWSVDSPAEQKPESLNLALAGATGVSTSSAHTVPALLLPTEVEGRRLTDLTDAKRVTDAKCDSSDCFRVEGNYAGDPTTIWIDKKTLLLRRIEAHVTFRNSHADVTTTYDPVIDQEIAPEGLEFRPPKEK